MTNTPKIIDRIQKLLRLASNAGSEAEAALAAERAATMMEEHEIHEAMLTVEAGGTPRASEPIERAFEVTKTKKKVAWHMRIVNAVASTYGARAYWMGGKVILFGRLSSVQAANYTSHYLMRAVETITDREAPTSACSKAFRNAFRLGCASRVAGRLDEAERAKRTAPPDTETGRIFAMEGDTEPSAPEPRPSNSMALAIVERDRKEVDDAYATLEKRFGPAPKVGNISSGGGYSAGRAAGDRVSLGGNARGGLPAGQGSLR